MSGAPIVFFPDGQPKYVNVYIEAPLGTDIVKTNEITKKLENRIIAALQPNQNIVEAVLAQVGEKHQTQMQGYKVAPLLIKDV